MSLQSRLAPGIKGGHVGTPVNARYGAIESPQDCHFRSPDCRFRAGELLGKAAHCSSLRSVSA